jgi:predicted nucleic acid-binding protein
MTATQQGELLAASSLLLPEVAGAIARRSGRTDLALRAASLLERLPNLRLVRLDAALARLAGQLAAELRLPEADASYVALAQRLGVPLVSWDGEQRERGAGLVPVVTPGELLAR